MTKLLLLDCDGTIREPIEGRWIDAPRNQKPIEGAAAAIAKAAAAGWTVLGITNQGGIAAGHKSLEEVKAEQRVTLELFPEISSIYFCPDFEGLECWKVERKKSLEIRQITEKEFGSFRKPGAGMLRLASLGWDAPEKTWFVGDREEDALAASAAGIDFMWSDIWRSLYLKGFQEVDVVDRHLSQEVLLKFLKDFQG
ncbi:MAG TPA: HAD-IIIA family hydrolase [Oculatellaceae cyanobacterium]